jgi:mRNA interferase MazF
LLNADYPSTLIFPLTTNHINDAEPLRLRVAATDRLHRDSDLLIDQLRVIDNRRLVQGRMTNLSAARMARVHEALSEVLDLEQDRRGCIVRDS